MGWRLLQVLWPVLLVFPAAECTSPSPGPTPVPTVDASALDKFFELNGFSETVRTVIRSPAEWKQFWLSQGLNVYAEKRSGVNFSRYMVLVAGAEVGGLTTAIQRVVRERDTIFVYVAAAYEPDSGDIQSLDDACSEAPVDASLIRRSKLPVRFIESRIVSDC
jgi:hypothetical protein